MSHRVIALFLALALAVPAGATPLPRKDAGPREYNPAALADREALTEVLRTHVGYVESKFTPKRDEIASDDRRDGFGLAIGPRRLVCLSWIVHRADKVWITGPKKVRLPAKVLLYDIERRVALLETELPLSRTGLVAARPALAAQRSYDQTVYAILSTGDNPFLANGVLTEAGETPELRGAIAIGSPPRERDAHLRRTGALRRLLASRRVGQRQVLDRDA